MPLTLSSLSSSSSSSSSSSVAGETDKGLIEINEIRWSLCPGTKGGPTSHAQVDDDLVSFSLAALLSTLLTLSWTGLKKWYPVREGNTVWIRVCEF